MLIKLARSNAKEARKRSKIASAAPQVVHQQTRRVRVDVFVAPLVSPPTPVLSKTFDFTGNSATLVVEGAPTGSLIVVITALDQ
ncbi:MAG: hypothetical protein EB084_24340, partial [Proteobacteria bacterium]|nr:hypothetical protein [Pseudomonadota bacterium]